MYVQQALLFLLPRAFFLSFFCLCNAITDLEVVFGENLAPRRGHGALLAHVAVQVVEPVHLVEQLLLARVGRVETFATRAVHRLHLALTVHDFYVHCYR